MKNNQKMNMIYTAIFWGALWGISEAIIGYILHLFTFIPGIAAIVMFPIAYYFIRKVYFDTGRIWTIFLTAGITAAIKLTDLFLPFLRPIKTINPAISILIEAIVVAALFTFAYKKGIGKSISFSHSLIISLSWRILYILISIPIFLLFMDGYLKNGPLSIVRFLTLDSVINCGIIFLFSKINVLKKSEWSYNNIIKFRPIYAAFAFISALGIEQFLIRL